MMSARGEQTLSLQVLVHVYLSERVAKGELRHPMTVRNHRSTLDVFIKAVGDIPPHTLSKLELDTWLAGRSHLTESVRPAELQVVKAFCAWLHKRRHLDVDPTYGLGVLPVAAPDLSDPSKPLQPLKRLAEAYLRERMARHEVTALTARNGRSTLYRFANVVGARPVDRLSRSDVERWLESRHATAAATRRGELSEVRSFCQWLVRRRHVRLDPTRGPEMNRGTRP